jgi:nitroimidazol reductase NimA-like FMN-containing flavoprotein (pyridoxamine 5'-phosphate oxidase superfamily)
MIGALTAEAIEGVLSRQAIGRLGLSGDDRIYIFPVQYGYDGTCLYLISREGHKLDLLRADPRVCLEVEEIESPARWRTVLVHGRFDELAEEADRDHALAVIGEQAGMLPPSIAPYLDGPEHVVVYRVRIAEKTGRFEDDQVFGASGTPNAPMRI